MVPSSSVAGVAAPAERAWRQRIEEVISQDEVRSLANRSLRDSLILLGTLWIEIAVLLLVANLLPRIAVGWAVVIGFALVLLIATRINALNVVIHEGSHGFLVPSRRLNDRLCNMGAAWWTFSSVEEYRPTHRLHHRYLGEERDPDRVSYMIPEGRGSLGKLLIQDILAITAIRRGIVLIKGAREQQVDGPTSTLPSLLGKAIAQLIVVAQFIFIQGGLVGLLFYAVFWVIPTLCVFPLILRLKTITEHYDPRLRDPGESYWIVRTSAAGALQNHLIGARMEYHFEHHVLPSIPYGGLKELHQKLDVAGMFRDHDEVLSHGYFRFLRALRTN